MNHIIIYQPYISHRFVPKKNAISQRLRKGRHWWQLLPWRFGRRTEFARQRLAGGYLREISAPNGL